MYIITSLNPGAWVKPDELLQYTESKAENLT